MAIMSENGSILTRPSGGILATDCGGAGPSPTCQDCAQKCVGGPLTLTLSGFQAGVPYASIDCTALNQTWVVPYAPLSYQGQVYAPCRWAIYEEAAVVTSIAIECDAYVAYPMEWTITVRINQLGMWPYGGWPIACATTFYKNISGKTGPVLFNCSGDHPTGSGPIYTGDGGSWYCGYGAQCYEQSGQYTIT